MALLGACVFWSLESLCLTCLLFTHSMAVAFAPKNCTMRRMSNVHRAKKCRQ